MGSYSHFPDGFDSPRLHFFTTSVKWRFSLMNRPFAGVFLLPFYKRFLCHNYPFCEKFTQNLPKYMSHRFFFHLL